MYILVGIKEYQRSIGKAYILHLLKPCNYVCDNKFVGDRVDTYFLEPGRYVFEGFHYLYDVLNCGIEIDYNSFKDPANVHVRLVDKNHYYLRKFV